MVDVIYFSRVIFDADKYDDDGGKVRNKVSERLKEREKRG